VKAAPPQPRRELVDRGPIVEKVSFTGKLSPKELWVVGTDIPAGRVAEVLPGVELGKVVEKDQPLLRLDDEVAQARLKQAEAAKQLAQAALRQAEAGKKRAEALAEVADAKHKFASRAFETAKKLKDNAPDKYELAEQGFNESLAGITAAQAALKEADAGLETANAKIKEAEAAYKLAEDAVKAMTIKAPVRGTIINKQVIRGQVITPQTSPVLFVIAPDLGNMELLAQVGESDITKVRIGMKVRFTVDAYAEEDTVFEGEVAWIGDVPVTSPQAKPGDLASALPGPVFFPIRVNVTPWGGKDAKPLKAGLNANVDLIVREVKDALRLPNQALNFRPDPIDPAEQKLITDKMAGGWKPVWVWKDGQSHLVFVKTGASDGSKTAVLQVEGTLQPGDEVIVEGPPSQEGGLFGGGKTPTIKF
jgi:HlyD family secretion protein